MSTAEHPLVPVISVEHDPARLGVADQPAFFLDLTDPHCYLAAERVLSALPVLAEWLPVSARALDIPAADIDREAVRRAAQALGLLPLRWPDGWPPDPELAALGATYAKAGGRTVAFGQALMRQAFAGGRNAGELDTILIAAAAAEMHPAAVTKGIALRTTRRSLAAAVARAQAAGVRALPAVHWRGRTFAGPSALDSAAAAMGAP